MFQILFSGLFVLTVVGLAVLAWCCVCFRAGCWLVDFARSGRRSRHESVRVEDLRPLHVEPPTNRPTARKQADDRQSSGIALVLALLVVCLLVFGSTSKSSSRPAPKTQATAGSSVEPKTSWTDTGLGKTREDARQRAVEKLYQDQVVGYFRTQLPQLEWTPSLEYVRDHLVKETRSEPDVELSDPTVGRMKQVSVRVEVTRDDHKDIIRRDRHFRTEQRLVLLGKVLAALVVFLTALALYVRLDECSKGYYTAWLRLAALGAVVAAGAGLWLLT